MSLSLYTEEECEKIARQASLRYINDHHPGFSRKKCGKGFAYYDLDGQHIKKPKRLKRITNLAIPPAYKNVWISPFENSHLQATGIDKKGRKQYIYHPLWKKMRKKQKFDLMPAFGSLLPTIRDFIHKELNKSITINKLQIICAITYLLDKFSVRIGNPLYSKENQSFGITTLRKKHLSLDEKQVALDFKGKNSKMWHILLKNKKMIRLLKKCNELPGYELFKYLDETNKLHVISSQDVNGFLHALTQKPFTAKDFRTWAASREFFMGIIQTLIKNKSITQNQMTEIIKQVAKKLGHTPNICQKSYLHPHILLYYQNERLHDWINRNQEILADLKKNHDEIFLHWLQTK
ncbi:DNA topoisomerase IB [Legionella impletisoli]|uniref:DNA topoisomerase n=1 Tax=Legionella impletisoli TaxID=343510 RepID=A0A917K199_9GAMM|nr:DNA topoisomerase IB [Legionella impletisoli]GGI92421.1 DNA topoisomerase I [Legionella impletisoli]